MKGLRVAVVVVVVVLISLTVGLIMRPIEVKETRKGTEIVVLSGKSGVVILDYTWYGRSERDAGWEH